MEAEPAADPAAAPHVQPAIRAAIPPAVIPSVPTSATPDPMTPAATPVVPPTTARQGGGPERPATRTEAARKFFYAEVAKWAVGIIVSVATLWLASTRLYRWVTPKPVPSAVYLVRPPTTGPAATAADAEAARAGADQAKAAARQGQAIGRDPTRWNYAEGAYLQALASFDGGDFTAAAGQWRSAATAYAAAAAANRPPADPHQVQQVARIRAAAQSVRQEAVSAVVDGPLPTPVVDADRSLAAGDDAVKSGDMTGGADDYLAAESGYRDALRATIHRARSAAAAGQANFLQQRAARRAALQKQTAESARATAVQAANRYKGSITPDALSSANQLLAAGDAARDGGDYFAATAKYNDATAVYLNAFTR